MKKTGSMLRQAINRHLYHWHGGVIYTGTTGSRLTNHRILHETTACDHTHPDPEDPTVMESAEA